MRVCRIGRLVGGKKLEIYVLRYQLMAMFMNTLLKANECIVILVVGLLMLPHRIILFRFSVGHYSE